MARTKYGWQWTDNWGRKFSLECMDNDGLLDGLCEVYNVLAIRDGLPTVGMAADQRAKLTKMARAIKGMPIPTSLIDLLQELESRHGTLAIWQLARINRIKSALNGFPDQEQTEPIKALEEPGGHLAIAKWMLP